MQTEYRWDNFDYGLIDSPFRAPLENANGGYQNGSFGIDTRTEPGCVLLGFENEYNFVTNAKPLSMVDLTRFGGTGFRVFTENGQVYDENGSIIHTLAGTTDEKKVLSATCLRDASGLKILMFSLAKVHTANASFSTVAMNAGTFTVQDTKRHPFVQVADAAVLVGSRNYVYSIDYAGAVTQKYKLPEGESITGMTLFQDLLTVYASNRAENTDNITGSGFQYMFQVATSASSWTYRQEWPGLPVSAAATIGGTDYVITGASQFHSDLFQVNGTQKRLLKSNTEGSNAKRCFLPVICTRIDDAYVVADLPELASNTVMRLGSYYPGMPTALTPEFELQKEVFGLFTYSDKYVVSLGKTVLGTFVVRAFNVSNTPAANRADSGQIISPIWNAGTNEYERSISEIKVNLDAYSGTSPAKGTVRVYARKNRRYAVPSEWVLLGTKAVDSTQLDGEIYEWTITKENMTSANFGNFRQVEFMVTLQGAWAASDTPVFRGLVARIEDYQKK